MRNKIVLLIAAVAACAGIQVSVAQPAQTATGHHAVAHQAVKTTAAHHQAKRAYDWGPIVTHSDFAGTGQLQGNYRIRQQYSVGFYVESVKICAASGGLAYQGIDGKGLSIWNENGVVKWSTTNTDLDPGQCRSWDLEIGMPDAATLKIGWYFTEIFVPGGNINQCARLTIHHSDWDSGGC